MTINKRTKSSRFRGSHTHGWGAKKKHRGSGHRGGRGRAGSGKRADAKKPSIWKDIHYFGKRGFTPHGCASCHTGEASINIKTLDESIKSLLALGACKTENSRLIIDLTKTSYTKLLSTGRATRAMDITVSAASPHAIKKIQEAGGQVHVSEFRQSQISENSEHAQKPRAARGARTPPRGFDTSQAAQRA